MLYKRNIRILLDYLTHEGICEMLSFKDYALQSAMKNEQKTEYSFWGKNIHVVNPAFIWPQWK